MRTANCGSLAATLNASTGLIVLSAGTRSAVNAAVPGSLIGWMPRTRSHPSTGTLVGSVAVRVATVAAGSAVSIATSGTEQNRAALKSRTSGAVAAVWVGVVSLMPTIILQSARVSILFAIAEHRHGGPTPLRRRTSAPAFSVQRGA